MKKVTNFADIKKEIREYINEYFLNSHVSIKYGNNTICCFSESTNDVLFVISNDKNGINLYYKNNWDSFEDSKENIVGKKYTYVLLLLNRIIKFDITPLISNNSKLYILYDKNNICPFCLEKSIIRTSVKMIDRNNRIRINKTRICKKCNNYFVKIGKLEWDKSRFPNYIYEDIKNNDSAIEPATADFLVKTSTIKCKTKNHKVKNIRALVNIMKDNTIIETEVPGYYCEECKKYFILENDYEKLRSKGIVLCKIIEQKLLNNQNNSYGSYLNSESILHSYGYNVNAQENLSSSERHTILEFLLNNKILSKNDIKSHLNYLVNRSKNSIKMYDAISKWESDISFIDNYNNLSDSILRINSLKIKIYSDKK